MAELGFFHSTVNSGKTLQIMKVIHDYEVNNERRVFVAKPKIDSKAGNCIQSRVGKMTREVDFLINNDSPRDILDVLRGQEYDVVLVDEAQFLSRDAVWALMEVAHSFNIPVKTFGLRVAYDGEPFIGSTYLFALADRVEVVEPVLCRIDGVQPATKNLRVVNGEPVFSGETVVIDGTSQNVEYIPVCSDEFMRFKTLSELTTDEGD